MVSVKKSIFKESISIQGVCVFITNHSCGSKYLQQERIKCWFEVEKSKSSYRPFKNDMKPRASEKIPKNIHTTLLSDIYLLVISGLDIN